MPLHARYWARILAVITIPLAIIIYWSAAPRLTHGLSATYYENPWVDWAAAHRIERIAILSSNDDYGINPEGPFRVTWEGFLYADADRSITFSVPSRIDATLVIDNQMVFETASYPPTKPATITKHISEGAHPLRFELSRSHESNNFFSAALEIETWLGNRPLAASSLYPLKPDPLQASRDANLYIIRLIAAILGVTAASYLFGTTFFIFLRGLAPLDSIGLLLIISAALALRLGYLTDLASNSAQFDQLPHGSDQRVYESQARDLLRGTWPPETDFYRQPGFSWLLGHVHLVLGTSLRSFQTLQLSTGAFATLAVFAIGRSIFGRGVAFLSAFLWATYPLAIFYDAQILTHGVEAQLTLWIICLWLHSPVSSRSNYKTIWPTAALGFLIGILSVLRPAMLALIPIAAISMVWKSGHIHTQRVIRCLIVIVCAAIPILPVATHNYHHTGRLQLISANGPVTLYLGNNRDAGGTGEYSQAFRATHERVNRGEVTYIQQTFLDLRDFYPRWLGLMVRKTALYWGNHEIPNNVDFVTDGLAISPLLRILPIRFGAIVALGATGLLIALRERKSYSPGAWLLALVLATLFSTTVAFHVVSRFRVPTYGPLIILSAFTLVELAKHLRQLNLRSAITTATLLTCASSFVLALPWVADHSMRTPTVKALPASAISLPPASATGLSLLGHDQLLPVEPAEPLFVTLYWSATTSLSPDYYASVQLLTTQHQKLAQADQAIGSGSFPSYTTSLWKAGDIVVDKYLLFPPKDVATPIGLQVLVAAYDRQTGQRVLDTTIGTLPLTYQSPHVLPDTAVSVQANIGPALLVAYDYVIDHGNLHLTLFWEAQHPSSIDGVAFLHILDAQEQFLYGHDAQPTAGMYPMSAWQPGEGIVDQRILPVSNLPASHYMIHIGVYDPISKARFPIVAADRTTVPSSSLGLLEFSAH